MNKSNISGWRDVCTFTFKQTMKSKAFLISFIIFVALAAASIPIISLISGNTAARTNNTSPIKKVYISNQTSFKNITFQELNKIKAYQNTTFEAMKEDYKTVSKRIEDGEKASIILTISVDNTMYSLSFAKASKGPVSDSALSQLGTDITKQFNAYKISALGITTDQKTMLDATVDTKVSMVDTSGKTIVKKDTKITMTEYGFIYGLLFVVLMVNSIASGQIATSIVTEKSTRVMEYLLTSVKPLALIIGKIIAMLAAVLIELVALVIVIFASNKISAILISGKSNDVLSKYLPSNIFDNLNILNLLLCIVFILLGLIFYATLAGLAGSTVSKIEELQEGLTLFTFTNIAGAYIGIAAINILMGSGENGFVTFAFLCPLSSPFLLPGAILVGKVSLPIAAASFALLIISNILLFRFVAKVFETLILHTGNKIKIKELIKFSKI